MASAGTLLSDLDERGGGGGGDGDLVQKILADMNIPSGGGGGGGGMPPPPPPMPQQAPPGYGQMPSSMQQVTMDSHIPTSHMIGNEHPTPADFAAAMVGVASSRPDIAAMAAPVGQPMPGAIPTTYEAPSKNLYGTVLQEAKVPLVVAFLFLVFSLPPIRVLIAHYAPSLIRPTGDYHMTGLLAVSLLVGVSFWVLQRVIAPLLSL
jgi:hypothetical protein